jgi:hypothetical protein
VSLWNLNQQRRRPIRNFIARRRLPPKRHSAACVEGDRSSGARVLNGWVGNSRATPGSCSSFPEVSDRVAIPALLQGGQEFNADPADSRNNPADDNQNSLSSAGLTFKICGNCADFLKM